MVEKMTEQRYLQTDAQLIHNAAQQAMQLTKEQQLAFRQQREKKRRKTSNDTENPFIIESQNLRRLTRQAEITKRRMTDRIKEQITDISQQFKPLIEAQMLSIFDEPNFRILLAEAVEKRDATRRAKWASLFTKNAQKSGVYLTEADIDPETGAVRDDVLATRFADHPDLARMISEFSQNEKRRGKFAKAYSSSATAVYSEERKRIQTPRSPLLRQRETQPQETFSSPQIVEQSRHPSLQTMNDRSNVAATPAEPQVVSNNGKEIARNPETGTVNDEVLATGFADHFELEGLDSIFSHGEKQQDVYSSPAAIVFDEARERQEGHIPLLTKNPSPPPNNTLIYQDGTKKNAKEPMTPLERVSNGAIGVGTAAILAFGGLQVASMSGNEAAVQVLQDMSNMQQNVGETSTQLVSEKLRDLGVIFRNPYTADGQSVYQREHPEIFQKNRSSSKNMTQNSEIK